MSRYNRHFYNKTSARPYNNRKYDRWTDQDYEGEIQRLNEVLLREKNYFLNAQCQLDEVSRKLRQAEAELDQEKSLKEFFIKKAKEAKQELIQMEKDTNPEILNTQAAKQITDTHWNNMEYKEHMTDYITKLEQLNKKPKSRILLEEMASTHTELSSQHESEVLQCQLQNPNKAYTEKITGQWVMEEITQEQQNFQQKVERLNENTITNTSPCVSAEHRTESISPFMSNSSDTEEDSEEEEQCDSDLSDTPKTSSWRKRRSLRKWKKRQRK